MPEELKNPYVEMTTEVFKTHLEQLKSVIEEKKIDVTQFFGEPITEEQKEKLGKVDNLESQNKKLSEEASAKDLSDNETKLAQANIDRIVSDIKKIDKDAPIKTVLESKFNNLQKLDILSGTQQIVQHYTDQISTIKTELGGDPSKGTQTFSKPDTTETAENIIKSMTPQVKKE